MEFLQNLGLFFFQTLIIVVGIIAVILTIAAVAIKNKGQKNFEVEILNEKEIEDDLKTSYDASNKESQNGYISVTSQDPACGMAFRAWLLKS